MNINNDRNLVKQNWALQNAFWAFYLYFIQCSNLLYAVVPLVFPHSQLGKLRNRMLMWLIQDQRANKWLVRIWTQLLCEPLHMNSIYTTCLRFCPWHLVLQCVLGGFLCWVFQLLIRPCIRPIIYEAHLLRFSLKNLFPIFQNRLLLHITTCWF